MIYDIIIIGAGPAGLTAAIYARRAGKSVLVLEKDSFGGQITFSPKLENYPGFESVSGNELAQRMLEQALGLGADVEMDTVTGLENGPVKTVIGEMARYEGRAVIIAAGARHRRLGLPREEEFIGLLEVQVLLELQDVLHVFLVAPPVRLGPEGVDRGGSSQSL